MWRIRAAVRVGVGAVVGAALAAAAHLTQGWVWAYVVVAMGLGPGVVVVVRWPRATYDHWRYEMTDDALELQRGVLHRVHSVIPYVRVQNVDIVSGPVERALGLHTLVMRTASSSTDSTIPGLDAGAAEELRREILLRAGQGDAA